MSKDSSGVGHEAGTWLRGHPPARAHLQLGLQQPDVLVLLGQSVQQQGHALQAGDTVRGSRGPILRAKEPVMPSCPTALAALDLPSRPRPALGTREHTCPSPAASRTSVSNPVSGKTCSTSSTGPTGGPSPALPQRTPDPSPAHSLPSTHARSRPPAPDLDPTAKTASREGAQCPHEQPKGQSLSHGWPAPAPRRPPQRTAPSSLPQGPAGTSQAPSPLTTVPLQQTT